MTASDPLAFLHDPRLAPHAVSALPAWLWSEDAAEILWANPTGAAIFGAATSAEVAGRRFAVANPAAQQIARMADSLPANGTPRLERLRGFGAGVGRLLVCSCARIALADGRVAILVAANAPAGPTLPLAERVHRLLAGMDASLAVFSRESELLYAAGEAKAHLGDVATLTAAGAQALAGAALANGRATGDTSIGALTLERIGSGSAIVLIATFDAPAAPPVSEPAAAPEAPALVSQTSSMGEEATPPSEEPKGEEATPHPGDAPEVHVASETPTPVDEPSVHVEDARAPPVDEPGPPTATGDAVATQDIALGDAIEPPPGTEPESHPHSVVQDEPPAPVEPMVESTLAATSQQNHATPPTEPEPAPLMDAPQEAPFAPPGEPAPTEASVPPHQPADEMPAEHQQTEATNAPAEVHLEPPPSDAPSTDEPHDAQVAAEASNAPFVEAPRVETAAADAPSEPPAPPASVQPPPPPERHHPLRFVWQTDPAGHFTVGSDEFANLLGPRVATLLGQPWYAIAATLGFDPEMRVARALDSHDTWSGLTVAWPVDGAPERIVTELSGLPMFGRDRDFRGYRGFGVCRDIAGMNAIMAARHSALHAPSVPAPIETPPAPVHLDTQPEPIAPVETPTAPDPVIETQPEPLPPMEMQQASDVVETRVESVAPVETPPLDTAPEAIVDVPAPPTDSAAPTPPVEEAPPPPVPSSHEPTPEQPSHEPPSPEQASHEPPSPETPHEPPTSEVPPAAGADTPPAPEPRPQLTLVPPAKNIVPFRSAAGVAGDRRPMLSPVERTAFQEIAKALGARVEGAEREAGPVEEPAGVAPEVPAPETPAAPTERPAEESFPRQPVPSAYASGIEIPSAAAGRSERAVLDRVPAGVLVYRGDRLLYANNTLLDWTGYEDLDAIAAAGGLERLFTEPGVTALGAPGANGKTFALTTRRGDALPVEGRMFSVTWAGETALLTVLTNNAADARARAAEQALQTVEARLAASAQAIEDIEERAEQAEKALRAAEDRLKISELSLRAAEAATRELESVLDTATDGVIVVNRDGVILASNRSAEALFGYESRELASRAFVDLFAPESHRAAHDYLTGLTRPGVASLLNDGREVIGRVAQGGLMPLFMTIGRIADGTDKFCAVFRDITQWKRAEEDLTNAKREAEKASSAKSDFLAKVSHEIRTPMNAIIGFSEVMMEERFGAIGNDRYKQYLKDIHASGEHVISLVNDLLDLSKIEAGKLELNFARVELNDVVAQCVAIMQPQANRERIIIRTSLPPTLPPVVADERSVRQIVLNLLSNSIKFTSAGGQVIVSTALTDHGEEVLRVRDTGVGMTEKELATALEPFRQVTTAGRTGPGTGLGLPLTKALAEANRASFTIKSAVDSGTLVEIAFPANRVLAE